MKIVEILIAFYGHIALGLLLCCVGFSRDESHVLYIF